MAKIWITRDLQGDDTGSLYFWKNKPSWNYKLGHYSTGTNYEDDAIVSLFHDCSDLVKILSVFELSNVSKGAIIELTIATKCSRNETLADKAQDLSKRMKSKKDKPTSKEVLAFLDELSLTDEEEEEEVDDGNGVW